MGLRLGDRGGNGMTDHMPFFSSLSKQILHSLEVCLVNVLVLDKMVKYHTYKGIAPSESCLKSQTTSSKIPPTPH